MASINGQPLSWEATIENGDFNRKITDMERRLTGFTQTANTQSSAMESFAQKAAAAAAGYLTLQGAAGFVQSMVRVRGEFQQLEIAYRTMLKSKEAGDKLMADTVKLAATTPFELKEVATGAKQLLAYGFAAKDITANLEMLGNVAAGVSAPLQEVAYVYGTLKTQGRAYARDIQQFTGRGIPIIKELATVLGVAESEVMKLVEAGKVGFPEVEKAFQNMTGSSGMFFNLMKEQSASLTGQLSNLSDSWAIMLNEIGQSNEGLFSDAIRGASTLVENYDKVITIVKGLVAVYGVYRAALIATMIHERASEAIKQAQALSTAKLTTAQALQAAGTKSLAAAQAALNRTMLVNPYFLAAAGIAGLITAYMTFKEETLEIKSAQELMADSVQDINSELGKQRGEVESLVKVIQAQGAAESVRLEAYNKLKEIAPDILKGLTLEEAATAKLTERVDEYVRALRKKLSINSYQEKYQESIEQQIKAEDELTKAIQRRENAKQTVAIFKRDGGLGTDAGVRAVNEATRAEEAVREAYNRLEKAKDTSEHINQLIEGVYAKGTRDFLEQEIAALEKTRQAFDKLSPEYAKIEKQIAEKRKQLESIAQGDEEKYEPKNRAYYEKIIADNQKDLNDLDKSAKDFQKQSEIYKKRILDAQKNLEAFDVKADRKASKDYEKLGEQRLAFLEQLTEKEAEIKRKGLNQNQQEIAEAQAKYAQLRKEAQELRLGAGVKQRINRLEEQETGDIRFRQETELIQKNLEQQKTLYAAFEEYKKDYGLQAATLRYQDEIDITKTYLSRLQEEIKKVESVDISERTGEQQKWYLELIKAEQAEIRQIQNAAFDENIKNFDRLVDATKHAASEKLRIEKQYQKDVEALEKNLGKPEEAEELAKRKEMLKTRMEMELDAVRRMAFEEGEFYKNMMKDITFYTREELKNRVREIKQVLKDQNLSPVERRTAKQALSQAQGLLRETDTAAENADKIARYAQAAAGSFGQLADTVRKANPDLAGMLDKLGEIAGAAGQAAGAYASFASGDILGGITQGLGAAQSMYKLFSDADEKAEAKEKERQRTMELTRLAIEGMNRALEWQAKIIERALGVDKITAYRQQLQLISSDMGEIAKKLNALNLTLFDSSGGRATSRKIVTNFKQLGDTVSLGRPDRGKPEQFITLDTIEKVIEHNQKELQRLYEMLATGKLSGDTEAMKELLATYEQLEAQLEQYELKLKEVVTGTTFQTIVDSIANGFKEGKKSISDFADTFQDLMRNAIIQSLKMQALEKPLKDFYDEFAEMSESGGSLDAGEIAQLKEMYDAIIKNAGEQFENLKDLTGISFGDSGTGANNQSGLAGAIRGITEEQADLLAGQFGAVRLHLAELVGMARVEAGLDKDSSFLLQQSFSLQEQTRIAIQNLAVQQRIELNTAQTAQNTAEMVKGLVSLLQANNEQARSLKSLDQKTVNWDSTLRMNGFKV